MPLLLKSISTKENIIIAIVPKVLIFHFVVEEALKHDIHLETSYAYDIEIIKKLYEKKKITKDIYIICNGFKQKAYTSRIANLLNTGFKNVIPVLDNKEELREYAKISKGPF